MTDFILTIPKSVLKDILTSWLTLPSVGKLDAALCVTDCREVLKQIERLCSYSCWNHGYSQSESFLVWVARRKVHLQDITVSKWLLESAEMRYNFFKETGAHLRKVIVSSKTISSTHTLGDLVNKSLIDMSRMCQNLEELEVLVPNDSGICALLARNPKLRRVDLEGGPELLCIVEDICPNISDLTIRSEIDTKNITKFLEALHVRLQKLSLIRCNACTPALFQQFNVCSNLLELRLGQFAAAGDVYEMEVTMPSLLLFRCVSPNSFLTKVACKRLAANMPQLQTLIVLESASSQESLTALFTHLPRLRQFATVEACESLLRPHPLPAAAVPLCHTTNTRARKRTSRTGLVADCALEELYTSTRADNLSPDIFSRCPSLQYLGLHSIPDGDFIAACTQARIKRLVITARTDTIRLIYIRGIEELFLHGCHQVKEQDFISLAHRNPDLQVLCIRDAGYTQGYLQNPVTHRPLHAFLESCPKLRSVEFMFHSRTYSYHPHAKAFLQQLIRGKYPNLEQFECNLF